MASVVEFDHNQLPAFEDQNSKRQMESNRMEAIQLGKLRNQVSKLQNELKAAKRKVTQLNQQVGYQSGARGTSSLFNGEVVVRLVPQITASQQRTKRGQMTGHGGKGAIMFAPGSSLRPGVAVRSRLPPQPSAYMFVLIYQFFNRYRKLTSRKVRWSNVKTGFGATRSCCNQELRSLKSWGRLATWFVELPRSHVLLRAIAQHSNVFVDN